MQEITHTDRAENRANWFASDYVRIGIAHRLPYWATDKGKHKAADLKRRARAAFVEKFGYEPKSVSATLWPMSPMAMASQNPRRRMRMIGSAFGPFARS